MQRGHAICWKTESQTSPRCVFLSLFLPSRNRWRGFKDNNAWALPQNKWHRNSGCGLRGQYLKKSPQMILTAARVGYHRPGLRFRSSQACYLSAVDLWGWMMLAYSVLAGAAQELRFPPSDNHTLDQLVTWHTIAHFTFSRNARRRCSFYKWGSKAGHKPLKVQRLSGGTRSVWPYSCLASGQLSPPWRRKQSEFLRGDPPLTFQEAQVVSDVCFCTCWLIRSWGLGCF